MKYIIIPLVFLVLLLYLGGFFENNVGKWSYDPKYRIYIYEYSKGKHLYTYNPPESFLSINYSLDSSIYYKNLAQEYTSWVFVFDPYLSGNFSKGLIQLQSEIFEPLELLGYNVTYACSKEHDKCDLVMTCNNVTNDVLCVEYENGDLKLEKKKNIIKISGRDENILLATDLFVYLFYGGRT